MMMLQKFLEVCVDKIVERKTSDYHVVLWKDMVFTFHTLKGHVECMDQASESAWTSI